MLGGEVLLKERGIKMKKLSWKPAPLFICLYLPFSFCVQTAMSDYLYKQQINSSEMSVPPPADTQEISRPPVFLNYGMFIGNSDTIRDTALNVIKTEQGDMPDMVSLETLAGQFSGSINIESTVKIAPANQAVLPAEALLVANAFLVVNPVNQDISPVMSLNRVEAFYSGKSPVPNTDAIKEHSLVKTEVSQQEQVPGNAGQSNPTIDFQKSEGADEKPASRLASPAQLSVSYTDAEGVIHKNIPLTLEVRGKLATGGYDDSHKISIDVGPMKKNGSSATVLISMVGGRGQGAAEFDKVDQACFAALKEIGLPVVKSLINELKNVSPRVAWNIEYFLACEYYIEADAKIKNQIVDIVLSELEHNSSPKVRDQMPTLLTRIYTDLNLLAAVDMVSRFNMQAGEKIQKGLINSLQNDPSPEVRFQAGYELLRKIGMPETLAVITEALCTDSAFKTMTYPPRYRIYPYIEKVFSTAFNVNLIISELIPYLGNKDTNEQAIILFAAIGQPAVEPLLMLAGNKSTDPLVLYGVVAALSKMDSAAVIMPLISIIHNPKVPNSIKTRIMEKVTFNRDFSVDRTQLQWKKLALDFTKPALIRAIAFSKIRSVVFLEKHVFNTINKDGSLSGLKQIAVEEFIAILFTGIPAKQGWWGRINDLETKTKYVQQIFAADVTDQRHFHKGTYNAMQPSSYRNWVCEQFATQVVMNSSGWNPDFWGDLDGFADYGAGYNIFFIEGGGYGMPIHCATGIKGRHTFNAIFMGNDFNEQSQRLDYKNWLFMEPQNDSPVQLTNTEIKIFPTVATYFTPDGFFIHDNDYILIKSHIKPGK